jgi:phosphopantetheine--protein transferase-like protein
VILGIGVDIAEIDRFKPWCSYSSEQLSRIFSPKELEQCKRNGKLSADRLASRFAAKEAFFKALSASLVKLKVTDCTFSFLFTCRSMEILTGEWDVPQLHVDWKKIENKIKCKLPNLTSECSLSHEKRHAVSMVVIQQG